MMALSKREHGALEECEQTIARAKTSFVEAGTALLRIREDRLYRAEYKTFEAYCRHRWELGRAYVNRQIAAAATVENLAPAGAKKAGLTEGAVRPLAAVPKEEQRAVFEAAVELANDRGRKTPTESDTKKAVAQHRAPKLPVVSDGRPDGMPLIKALQRADGLIKQSREAVLECVGLASDLRVSEYDAKWLFQHGRELESALRELVRTLQGE